MYSSSKAKKRFLRKIQNKIEEGRELSNQEQRQLREIMRNSRAKLERINEEKLSISSIARRIRVPPRVPSRITPSRTRTATQEPIYKYLEDTINEIKKLNKSTNYNYKPSYISAIRTGYDLLYLNDIKLKKEKLVEIFLGDFDDEGLMRIDEEEEDLMSIEEDKDEELMMDNFLKCVFLILDVDNYSIDIYEKEKKGGAFSFTPTPLIAKFLKYQYIYDNHHDFNSEKSFSDGVLYTSEDIPSSDSGFRDYFGMREPVIFNKIITNSPDILDNILYFSIYNFVNYNKEVDDILGKIIVEKKEDIDLIKTNIEKFLADKMGSKEVDYVVDMKINFGNMSLLDKFGDKLKSLGVITDVSRLLNEASNWNLIKEQIKELFDNKRFYTLEDTFDSAPLDCNKALPFFKDTNINCLCYISYLIFNDSDFIDGSLVSLNDYKEIFKAFNKDLRSIFEAVYYKTKAKEIRTALIFKDTSFFANRIDTSKFIKIIKGRDYLYEEDDRGDLFAIDLCENKGFNTINKVIEMIKLLYDKTTINSILSTNLTNIITAYVCYKFVKSISKNLTNDEKKQIARALFDLKKAGDISRILFVFFYNFLKKNSINTSITSSITSDICYTGNDKLADLNSIIRKGNNVVFPDTTNFSICLYNVNNKDYSYKDFYTSANIYLISKFIKNGLDIFETIATFPPPSSTPIDMANVDRIKSFNNIIRNISYDKIILLKENVINKDKIYEEVKNEIRLNFIKLITDKTRLIQLLENCEKNIREKNSREADEVKILLDKIKVSTQTDIFELAKEIGLDYKICNYNHMKKNEEIQNELERIKINKNLKDINYYRFLSFYNNIIQSLALFNDITKFNSRTFQQELNNNIKFIMTGYLKHIENNIRENLEKTDVIQYFAEKIIFDKVKFNPTIKNIYYEITRKILKNISISNKSIIKKIIKIINETDKDLLDPEILKKMLNNIHNYLKIIDIFVFYTSGIQDENPTNIHECIVELRKYIFDLLAYKKNITSQDKKKINFFTITKDPKILFTNIIEANISKEYKLRGVGIKSFHLIKNFFKNIDNMNYVIFFNNFYNHFDKLKDLKILDIPLENDKNHLKMIIKQIKDIYTYTYINI